MKNTSSPSDAFPWWRVPTMWLVIAGPAVVVIASLAMLAVALRGGDLPIRNTAPQARAFPAADAMTPAAQARNHVATPSR